MSNIIWNIYFVIMGIAVMFFLFQDFKKENEPDIKNEIIQLKHDLEYCQRELNGR